MCLSPWGLALTCFLKTLSGTASPRWPQCVQWLEGSWPRKL
ncbi:hypothetical protein MC885_007011 [Smutsia gigantea]|nr:hypothetical protein MC885_007011 [Smutsia gigantea]